MTFGRPGAIPQDYIRLDLPKTIPPPDASDSAHGAASIAFFNSTMQALLPSPFYHTY